MLDYDLENRGELSLYEFVYRSIRRDIEAGTLAPHEKLPSKRTFAQHLGVSLITVENAYAQLVTEGYCYTKPRSGYYVSELSAVTDVSKPDKSAPATFVSSKKTRIRNMGVTCPAYPTQQLWEPATVKKRYEHAG